MLIGIDEVLNPPTSGTDIHQGLFSEIAGDADIILLKNRMWFWLEQRTPLPHDAPFSSMVLILGGGEGVIERARATWSGVYVPKRTATPGQELAKATGEFFG